MNQKYTRRAFLSSSLKLGLSLSFVSSSALFLSCKNKAYRRRNAKMNLGHISDFLYKKVYLQENQVLVVRFDDGWGALSTTCSKDGCDLSFNDQSFICPCCRSEFDHFGKLLGGAASKDLSWIKLETQGNSFAVQTGEIVSSSKHVTSKEIEDVILKNNFIFKDIDEINESSVKLPSIFYEE